MLKVDASIRFGNAGDLDVDSSGDVPVVSFTAEPHGGPEAMWFCFRLAETRRGTTRRGQVKLVLKHFHNLLGASRGAAVRPVIRRPRKDWQRLPAGTEEILPDGRVEVSWLVDAPRPWLEVALCYPYGGDDVARLVKETRGYWRAETIGLSQGGRPIVRLSNLTGYPAGERPGAYLIARQHSGETPGSWVLDGLLRALAESPDRAPLVCAVPLANTDGVEQGDYGKDNFPYDLNRAWDTPAMRHETHVIQRDMRRWQRLCRPMVALDFHAPGMCETDGVYAYLPKPGAAPAEICETAAEWAAKMQQALGAEYASERFARTADYRSRWETPTFTVWCATSLQLMSLALETPYATCGATLMTREAYQDAGRRLAACILESV